MSTSISNKLLHSTIFIGFFENPSKNIRNIIFHTNVDEWYVYSLLLDRYSESCFSRLWRNIIVDEFNYNIAPVNCIENIPDRPRAWHTFWSLCKHIIITPTAADKERVINNTQHCFKIKTEHEKRNSFTRSVVMPKQTDFIFFPCTRVRFWFAKRSYCLREKSGT